MRILTVMMLLLLLASCIKPSDEPDECAGVDDPVITIPSTIQAGEELQISLNNIFGAEAYYWTGPNGFESREQEPVIRNVQKIHEGTYTVDISIVGGCKKTATSGELKVTVPTASCSPGNNTASISGAGSMSFYSVSGAPSGGSYFITANGTGGDLEIEFPGTSKPLAGLYTIQPLSGSWLLGDVRVRLVAQSSNWPASSGKLYVEVINNKVSATFCSIPVYAQTWSFHSTASGKVTEK